MTVTARIDWVLLQLYLGRKIHLALSTAQDFSKAKCKIVVYPLCEGSPSAIAWHLLYTQLVWIRNLTLNTICVDWGHEYSKGTSMIQIWFSEHAYDEAVIAREQENLSCPSPFENDNTGRPNYNLHSNWFPERPPGQWSHAPSDPHGIS